MESATDIKTQEVFSNAEFHHLRNCVVELVEELKLRRDNDAESEERIRLLVNDRYNLERRCDSEVAKLTTERKQHARNLADQDRNFLEKTRLLEEENKQLKTHKKCDDKETRSLEDNIQSLQLAKYSLEKNIREREHKLQSHLSSSNQQREELSTLEEKLQSMTSFYQQVIATQERLEKNGLEVLRNKLEIWRDNSCVLAMMQSLSPVPSPN